MQHLLQSYSVNITLASEDLFISGVSYFQAKYFCVPKGKTFLLNAFHEIEVHKILDITYKLNCMVHILIHLAAQFFSEM